MTDRIRRAAEQAAESLGLTGNSERENSEQEGGSNLLIGLEEARSVISAAEQKAQEIGQPMNIAVVDGGRNLKFFARMEDAWLGSIDIAIDKAFTAASFKLSTQDLGGMAQPSQPLFGINTTNDCKIVIFGGGIPLMRDDQVIGAVGVSGGTPDQDHEVAEAGVAALSL